MTPFDEIKTILDRIAATGVHTEADRTALLSALRVDGKGNVVVQIGKYNVRIEHGQDIQIGDRITYEGPDAEVIRQTIRQMLLEYRLRPGIPFQAPPLPEHFVTRPEVTEALKARLLTDRSATAPDILVVSAIHGLGGIGKSTLAAALAHDPEVQRRFKDGILWATLGQQPDLLSLLSSWIQALGDYNFRPTTVEAASTHLRTLLQDKTALLVVDDVWEPEHALPFRVGGPQGQVLITTRRADVADEVGATLHQMDVMTPEQTLDLLASRLRRILDEVEQGEALQVAKAVGYLPLALELAAARIARGTTWIALQKALETEVAQLEALEGPRRRRGGLRLEASFNLSLKALRAYDEKGWEAFIWLGVLPEDARIAAPTVAILWEMEREEAAEVLELLWNDALLLPAPPIWVGELEWPAYRLHDLLHDIARRLLTRASPDGLGAELSEAHASLLERYKKLTQNNLWHTLPDDGYIHPRLAWHMERAGRPDELHTLLREETATGQNGWYEARDRLGQTAGYLEDVARAWRLVENGNIETTSPKNIGLQIRYALITTSLNSLAKNLPVALLTAFTEKGIWTPAQALAYARQVPERAERAVALASVSAHLTEPSKKEVQHEALTLVRAIEDPNVRAKYLFDVTPHLPEPVCTEVLEEMLKAVQAIERQDWRNEGLEKLVSKLIKLGRPKEALMAAQAIEWDDLRTKALTNLIPHLSDPDQTQTKQAVLEAVQQILKKDVQIFSKEEERVIKIPATLPAWAPPLLAQLGHPEEALVAVQRVRYEDRAEALTELASLLTELPLLRKVLEMAQSIQNETDKVILLGTIALGLADHGSPEEALEITRTMQEKAKVVALATLTSYLPEPLREKALQEALQIAQATEDPVDRVSGLVTIIPHLPTEVERLDVLGEAMTVLAWMWEEPNDAVIMNLILQLGEAGYPNNALRLVDKLPPIHPFRTTQAQAIRELVFRLVELDRLEEALIVTGWLGEGTDAQVSTLAYLAPYLSKPMLQEILTTTWQTGDEGARNIAIARLASMLAELGRPEEAKLAVKAVQWRYAKALIKTALHLSPPLLYEALAKAYEIEFETMRVYDEGKTLPAPMLVLKEEKAQATSLAALAPYLPEPLLREALTITQEFDNEAARITAEMALIPRFAQLGRPGKTLKMARTMKNRSARAKVLIELVSLPIFADVRGKILEEALESARFIKENESQSLALGKVLQHLTGQVKEQVFQEAIMAARKIEDEKYRAGVLMWLSTLITSTEQQDGLLKEVLTIVQGIEHDWRRAEVLVGLAPRLPKPLLSDAIAVVESLKETTRAYVLEELIPRQAELGGYREALDAARKLPIATRLQSYRALTLARLTQSPSLADQRDELLKEALEAAKAVDKLRQKAVLAQLVPQLSEKLLPEALAIAREITAEEALKEIALQLINRFDQWQEALEIRQGIEDKQAQVAILAAIVPNVSEPLKGQILQEALTITRSIFGIDGRVEAITELISHLPEHLKDEILQEALIELQENWQTKTFVKLVPCLSEVLLPEALEVVRTLEDDKSKVACLEKLIPRLPKPLKVQALKEALAALKTYGTQSGRTEAMEILAPYHSVYLAKQGRTEEALLTCQTIQAGSARTRALIELALLPNFVDKRHKLLEEALIAAQAIEYEWQRVSVLLDILRHLVEPKRTEVVQQVLEISLALQNAKLQAETLVKLAEYMSDPERTHLLRTALTVTSQKIQDENERVKTLVELAMLPALADWRDVLLQDAWTMAQMIQSPNARVEAMAEVIPHLPESVQEQRLQEAMATVQMVKKEDNRVQALAKVIPCMAKLGHFEKAMTAALEIRQVEYQAEALVGSIRYLPDNLLPRALVAAQAINHKGYRWDVLEALAPRLGECPRDRLYPIWQEMLHFLTTHTRKDLLYYLRALAPIIPALGEGVAVAETTRAIQNVSRWWP